MGCSASRPGILLGKAVEASPPAPRTRSFVTPLVHHPPTWEGDSHHLVSLTSTTYGSLILVDHRPSSPSAAGEIGRRGCAVQSHSPDSVINAWELMEGLEDEDGESDFYSAKLGSCNPLRCTDTRENTNSRMNLVSLYSINNVSVSDSYVFVEKPHEITEEWSSNLGKNSRPNSKPLWKHLSEESLLSKMDPHVVSSYERALSSRQLRTARPGMNTISVGCTPTVSRFSSVPSSPLLSTPLNNGVNQSQGCGDKIVLYFTSLRGIRKTYDDCCAVRAIFRGLRVPVDEKDISMDSAYRKELKDLLGGKAMSLPQLFIRGKNVGGVDEIKQLNEDGELTRLLDGFPVLKESGVACDTCGDVRFVPCGSCNGSRKVFEEDEERTGRCPDCNENGLIRCPACCS